MVPARRQDGQEWQGRMAAFGMRPVCWTVIMNLTVKGKNIDVGDALKTRAAESLDHIFAKYFSNPIDATVTMSREAHLFTSQISVHVGRGILLQSEGAADTANAAYDTAAETLAKRLRRYKRRLRDHHRASTEERRSQYYVLAQEAGRLRIVRHGIDGGDQAFHQDRKSVV